MTKIINMNKTILFLFTLTFISTNIFSQKNITITTTPADAEIFAKYTTGEKKIGEKGVAKLILAKKTSMTIIVRKEGYVDVVKVYNNISGGTLDDKIELIDRVIKINTNPSDAKIFINNIEVATSKYNLILKRGETANIEVKKKGFVTKSKIVQNKSEIDIPASSYVFTLEDRLINITTKPIDANIYIDDKKVAEGNTEAIIPMNNCIKVKIEKSGYSPLEYIYCNKETEVATPSSVELILKERLVAINASMEDAKILIDGKEVAKGSFNLKIPEGKCTEVQIKKESFMTQKLDICNKKDYQEPEPVYSIKMVEDDAYRESEQSNIANINFAVQINPTITRQDAWQTLASIIQSKFDEIESIDGSTSYLRTNWAAKEYRYTTSGYVLDNIIVRTRVIVTNGGTNPIKFNVKIQSEISIPDCSNLNPQNDQCFESWPRILRKYNDLISEIQRRLQ